jgi:hypothetical protein
MQTRPCSLAIAKRIYLEGRHVGLSGVRTWFVDGAVGDWALMMGGFNLNDDQFSTQTSRAKREKPLQQTSLTHIKLLLNAG